MLQKSRNVLLISDVENFTSMYKELALSIGVKLHAEASWHVTYRVPEDVVILGAKHLETLNPTYYSKAVLLLRPEENPVSFAKKGISRFIFDYQNQYELVMALFYEQPVIVHAQAKEVAECIREYGYPKFEFGDYSFAFDRDVFRYKDKPIYLCESQKRFLAEWLIGGHKDNKKRMILCNLRKKFGEDFLKDVNRFGEIKEVKNE